MFEEEHLSNKKKERINEYFAKHSFDKVRTRNIKKTKHL